MQPTRYTRIAVRVTAVLAALLLGMVALSLLEHRRTQGELGSVLSAFFSDRLLRDVNDSGSGRHIQVILLREQLTRSEGPWSGTWKDWWLNFLPQRQPPFRQASPLTRCSFFLSNLVTTNMRAELRPLKGLDFIVVSRSELQTGQPGDFERRFPDNFGYFGVSQAGFNFSRTEAVFYIDHYCGGLCGGGEYVLMRKVNGVWRVVDLHMVWVS